jgi:hypothetical protein
MQAAVIPLYFIWYAGYSLHLKESSNLFSDLKKRISREGELGLWHWSQMNAYRIKKL